MMMECLPSTVMQMTVLCVSKDQPIILVFALFSSVGTGAFLAAILSYDYDVSSRNTKASESFYGCILKKSGRKALVFLSLLLLSAFTLSRSSFPA